MIVGSSKKIEANSGKLIILKPIGQVHDIFKVLKLFDAIPIIDDMETAIKKALE